MKHRTSPWLVGHALKSTARARLYCFPHGGGSAQAFQGLAGAIGPDVDLVAIQPPGRGPRLSEPNFENLDALLDDLLPVLIADIDRPYALLGHSVGALIAFAAARRLEEAVSEPPLAVFVSSLAVPGSAPLTNPQRRTVPDWLNLPDHVFLAELARFGPIDERAWRNDDLRSMIVAPTRADFTLAQTANLSANSRLGVPLIALGGSNDREVHPDEMERWRNRTSNVFSRATFEGGHFYFDIDPTPVCELISETLAEALTSRPPSMAFGPVTPVADTENLYNAFEAAHRAAPQAVALVDGARSWTFAALSDAAVQLAENLTDQGVRQYDFCGLCLPTSAETVIAMLATMRLGAAFFQIPTSLPQNALADLMDQIKPGSLIATPDLAARFSATSINCPLILTRADGSFDQVARVSHDTVSVVRGSPAIAGDVAFGVLSSGTTGRPKAILCTHRSAFLGYGWRNRELPAEPDENEAANIFFIWEVLRPLLAGRSVSIIDDDTIRDVRKLADTLAIQGITRILLTPSLFAQLLTVMERGEGDQLPALRTLILNGEVVDRDLMARATAVLPNTAIINDYSISECHDVATTTPATGVTTAKMYCGPAAPSGAVMDGVRVYILDENGDLVPHGVPGHIHVAGHTLGKGYLNAADEMAARFVPDPFQPSGALMFKTGDVGRLLPDGQLQVCGRSAFMVKLRGYSIIPAAVEATLRQHSAIVDAVVMAIDHPDTGQPDHLACAVVLTPPAAADDWGRLQSDIVANLRQSLAPEAIPTRFVTIEKLPLSPATGKRDLAALKETLATQQLNIDAQRHSEAAPQGHDDSAIHAAVIKAWTAVIGEPPTSPDAQFFDSGGHSLKAGELAFLLSTSLKQRVDVADIYANPICKDLIGFLKGSAPQATFAPLSTSSSPRVKRAGTVTSGSRDIAVVGMACRFPGITSPEDLWRVTLEGRETHRQPEAATGAPLLNAALENVGDFDPAFWGLSPREATMIDPQHRLFFETCWQALENAGHKTSDVARNIGIYAGCYLPTYLVHCLGAKTYLDVQNPMQFHLAEIGNDKDYLAARAAYLMNLHGPAVSVQTSCSSGLVAICQAADALRAGTCRMALAGAASLTFPRGGLLPVEGHVVSPTGQVRTFDVDADGTILGEGVGVVVLRPLQDAIDDGNTIHAVIKGYAVNNDGRRKAGFSAPSVSGQTDVLRQALEDADVASSTVGYIEAHGTGTRIGDPLEVRALRNVYGARSESAKDQPAEICALGAVKPNIGHPNIAAGVAGFIKAVMTLKAGQRPRLTNYTQSNPELGLDGTRLTIPTETSSWPEPVNHPRRAAVSSFGIGGTNAHVLLEASKESVLLEASKESVLLEASKESVLLEASKESVLLEASKENVLLDAPPHIGIEIGSTATAQPAVQIVLSAKTPEALAQMADALAEVCESGAPPTLNDIAFTLSHGREVFGHSLAITATTHAQAASALREATRNGQPPPDSTIHPTDIAAPEQGRRIPLPTYPFARQQCWPASSSETPRPRHRAAERLSPLQRFYLPTLQPVPIGPPRSENSAAPLSCLIRPSALSGTRRFAAELEAALKSDDASHVTLSAPRAFQNRNATDDDIHTAAKQLAMAFSAALPGQAPGTIDVILPGPGGLLIEEPISLEPDDLARATLALIAVAQALTEAQPDSYVRLWMIGPKSGRLSGPDGAAVLHDMLSGTALSISQELARCEVRCLTHDPAEPAHRTIATLQRVQRAGHPPPDLIAHLIRGQVHTAAMTPYALSALDVAAGRAQLASPITGRPASPGGGSQQPATHLITGGLGRIGRALATHLVGLGANVVLTTRRTTDALPDDVHDDIASSRGRLQVVTLDVTSPDDLLRCFDRIIARGQAIGTVFHCAGLADLKYIGAQKREALSAEFEPKVAATQALARAIQRLEHWHRTAPVNVMLFSSLAADLGGLGMSGYAPANRYLSHVAKSQNLTHTGPDVVTRWIAVHWDDWAFTYDKEQTAAYARTRAHLALPVAEAIEALEAILGRDEIVDVAVAATDLNDRWVQWRARPTVTPDAECGLQATPQENPGEHLPNATAIIAESGGLSEARIVEHVLAAYRKVLGHATLDPGCDFFDCGGDSLLAADVVAVLEMDLPPAHRPQIADILTFATPASLAATLVARCQSSDEGDTTNIDGLTPAASEPVRVK